MVNASDVEEYIRIKEYIIEGKPVYSANHNNREIASFQKDFSYHYRVRCSKDVFYRVFEEMRLQTNALTGTQAFSTAIERLADSRNRNRIEFSFASKMISTLYDDMPIWDSFISRKLLIPEAPNSWPNNKRIEYTKQAYKRLCDFYLRLQEHTEIWSALIADFDKVGTIPNIDLVSDYRKIDFVLWSDEKIKNEASITSDIDMLIHDILFENA